MERTPNTSRHRKLTLEKKILPLFPPGMKTRDLPITSPAALYQPNYRDAHKAAPLNTSYYLSDPINDFPLYSEQMSGLGKKRDKD